MFDKVKEIAESWIIAVNPTDKQMELATDRYEICQNCPSLKKALARTKLEYFQCGECGCPISKKIFSPNWNACPLEKWKTIENKFFDLKEKSKNKTII
jgi:ribosomal protein L37AE/L43A